MDNQTLLVIDQLIKNGFIKTETKVQAEAGRLIEQTRFYIVASGKKRTEIEIFYDPISGKPLHKADQQKIAAAANGQTNLDQATE